MIGKEFYYWTVIGHAPQVHGKKAWVCKCQCGTVRKIQESPPGTLRTKSCGCRPRKKDFKPGTQFGRLTILQKTTGIGFRARYLCRCKCGTQKEVAQQGLVRGSTKSCGCLQKEKASERFKKDLTEKVYGRLRVVSEVKERRGEKIIWLCVCECGGEALAQGGALKSGSTRSCGCLQRELTSARAKKCKGPNSSQWNPSLTNKERKQRRSAPGLDAWKQSVFTRDNYACQLCRERGGKLNAHHKDGWHWCKEKRLSLDNSITLCNKCHLKFHHEHGKKNNTAEQFESYRRLMYAKNKVDQTQEV